MNSTRNINRPRSMPRREIPAGYGLKYKLVCLWDDPTTKTGSDSRTFYLPSFDRVTRWLDWFKSMRYENKGYSISEWVLEGTDYEGYVETENGII